MPDASSFSPFLVPAVPMTIGLRPIAPTHWLEVDDRRERDLAEKRALLAEKPDEVWAEERASRAAQDEAARLVREDLALQSGRSTEREETAAPPLLSAALAVQEDLLLMERGAAGWRLVAGSLSFPSSWRLREKFGRPLEDIHAPVPGFGAGARNAAVVTRIFDALRSGAPVERAGWSLYDSPALHQPSAAGSGEKIGRTDATSVLATPHLRVERQTLHKLPQTGAVLFTVRIHVVALAALAEAPNAQALLDRLSGAMRALSPEQAAYKRLDAVRDTILERLDAAKRAARGDN